MDVPASRRPPGRPRYFPERTVPVSASVPVDVADRLCRLAHQRGQSLSGVVRGILICSLREPPSVPPKEPHQ